MIQKSCEGCGNLMKVARVSTNYCNACAGKRRRESALRDYHKHRNNRTEGRDKYGEHLDEGDGVVLTISGSMTGDFEGTGHKTKIARGTVVERTGESFIVKINDNGYLVRATKATVIKHDW